MVLATAAVGAALLLPVLLGSLDSDGPVDDPASRARPTVETVAAARATPEVGPTLSAPEPTAPAPTAPALTSSSVVAGQAAQPAETPVPSTVVPAPSTAAPPVPATAVPTPPSTAAAVPATPEVAAPPSSGATVQLRTVFDERFGAARPGWPNDSSGTAWVADGGYRLQAKQPSRFVAVGMPTDTPFRDGLVSATFPKLGGPSGGGYGLVLRDDGSVERDGINQGGRFYVFELGDRGEFGVWRREGDQWIDIVPWSPSDAVRKDDARNVLTVAAIGADFAFEINGTVVARVSDATLPEGGVGLFVGGDQNDVLIERAVLRTPS